MLNVVSIFKKNDFVYHPNTYLQKTLTCNPIYNVYPWKARIDTKTAQYKLVSSGVFSIRWRRIPRVSEVNIPIRLENYDILNPQSIPDKAKSKARLLLNKVPRYFFSTNLKLKNSAGMATGRQATSKAIFMRT